MCFLDLVADVSNRPYDCGLCGREAQRSFLPIVADVSDRPYVVCVVLPLVADVSDRPYVVCVVLPLVADVSDRPYDCGLYGPALVTDVSNRLRSLWT